MTGRAKLGWVAAAVFTFINVAGAGYAVANGETVHALVHVGLLLLLGLFLAWRAPRTRQDVLPGAQEAGRRLEQLQQSVDAIAVEVERIGEAQRYNAKLQAERGQTVPVKKPPAEP